MTREMAVMGREGDTKIEWDPEKPFEVENAKRTFDAYRAKGYTAFLVTEDGEQDRQIREFDPQAARIIFVPQMQGG